MTPANDPDYCFTVESGSDATLRHRLQQILNEYHQTAYPTMEVPTSRQFTLRLADEAGRIVGGALFWAYWGWLDVSLIAVSPEVRGRGLGRRLLAMIEDEARQQGCTRIRVETFEQEVGFYERLGYRIVGCLEDYPEGNSYYWMRKDLAQAT